MHHASWAQIPSPCGSNLNIFGPELFDLISMNIFLSTRLPVVGRFPGWSRGPIRSCVLLHDTRDFIIKVMNPLTSTQGDSLGGPDLVTWPLNAEGFPWPLAEGGSGAGSRTPHATATQGGEATQQAASAC